MATTDYTYPDRDDVERFFIAVSITVGMIFDEDNRDEGAAQQFFAFRQRALPDLPYLMKDAVHEPYGRGISCEHPMSFDHYVQWCRNQRHMLDPNFGVSQKEDE